MQNAQSKIDDWKIIQQLMLSEPNIGANRCNAHKTNSSSASAILLHVAREKPRNDR